MNVMATAKTIAASTRVLFAFTPRLLQVALDGAGVAHVRVVGVAARVAQRAALAEQIPAAVQLDLHRAQPLLVGLERLRVEVVGLLALAQVVLLGDEALDPVRDALVAHGRILLPVVVHDLDVVSVRIEDVGGVVAAVITPALARAAVAPVAGTGGGVVEALDVAIV